VIEGRKERRKEGRTSTVVCKSPPRMPFIRCAIATRGRALKFYRPNASEQTKETGLVKSCSSFRFSDATILDCVESAKINNENILLLQL
jgi:hypothetical protein